MKVFKGDILSVDQHDHVFQYLVEDNGRILYVGNSLPESYSQCETIDLGTRALIPTFCDSHQHFASFAVFNSGLNVMEAESNAEILQMLARFSENCKDKILITFGASPYSVVEKRLISKEELDSVCPSLPVFMVKYDGHACIVNSALLKKINKKVCGLRGYHPDTGEMNQEAFFAVSDYVTNSIPVPKLIQCMKKAVDYEISKGIGMVHSVSGVGFPFDLDITTEALFSRFMKNGFQIRVFPQSMNTKVAKSRRLPRIGGCFKCALDGCFGSQDAAMNSPYSNNPDNSGVLYYSDEQVIEFCKEANRMGLQIEMHAIGDRAFDQACKALKAALDDYPRDDHRHGIIHGCLPTESGMEICEKYHIQLPMQIAFDDWRQEPIEYTGKLLGKERSSQLNPIKSFSDRGCIVSFGSDGPCTDPEPIVWLDKAVNHSNPAEAVSIQQALRMSTYNGYWTAFDEKDRGSLEVGKIADMVILSANPYSIEKSLLGSLRVDAVYLSGMLCSNS